LLEAHSKSEDLLQETEDLEADLLDAELHIEELKLAEERNNTQIEDLTARVKTAETEAQLLLDALTDEETGGSNSRSRNVAISRLDQATKLIVRKRNRSLKRLQKAIKARESSLLEKLSAAEFKVQLLEKEKLLEQLNASHVLHDLEHSKEAKAEAEGYIKKLHCQKSYFKRKSTELESQLDAQSLESEETINTLISKHEEELEKLLQASVVQTYTGKGKLFTDTIRTVYYKLISLNVPTNKIHQIIHTILQELALQVTVGKLPSRTTAAQFRKECVGLAYQQTPNVLGGASAHKHQTLSVDEASKQRKGFLATIQTTVIDGERTSLVVGLRRTFHKTAVGAQVDYERLLADIELVNSKRLGPAAALKQIVNIVERTTSSQTDRGASVRKFVTEIFPKFRATLLESKKEGWADLTPEEQVVLTKVVAHDCNNHFWHNVGVAALKVLAAWESSFYEEAAAKVRGKGNACAAETAVWAAMKDISWRASEQAGFGAKVLIEWLDSEAFTKKHFKDADLKAMLGNRFNVVFENAAGLYHILQELRDFYKGETICSALVHGSSLTINQLCHNQGLQ
jgi:hypothetical protein